VRILPGVASALSALQRQGWKLVIVSNQSGVARGLISNEEAQAVHQRFLDLMQANGVTFLASYFCPHLPDAGCECRKPSPVLLQRAAAEHGIDLARSWMIGDREDDIRCGKNAGCSTIWLRNEKFSVDPTLTDFVASDWEEIWQGLEAGSAFPW
jgi:histidinol-phosphate phosphatase family protein